MGQNASRSRQRKPRARRVRRLQLCKNFTNRKVDKSSSKNSLKQKSSVKITELYVSHLSNTISSVSKNKSKQSKRKSSKVLLVHFKDSRYSFYVSKKNDGILKLLGRGKAGKLDGTDYHVITEKNFTLRHKEDSLVFGMKDEPWTDATTGEGRSNGSSDTSKQVSEFHSETSTVRDFLLNGKLSIHSNSEYSMSLESYEDALLLERCALYEKHKNCDLSFSVPVVNYYDYAFRRCLATKNGLSTRNSMEDKAKQIVNYLLSIPDESLAVNFYNDCDTLENNDEEIDPFLSNNCSVDTQTSDQLVLNKNSSKEIQYFQNLSEKCCQTATNKKAKEKQVVKDNDLKVEIIPQIVHIAPEKTNHFQLDRGENLAVSGEFCLESALTIQSWSGVSSNESGHLPKTNVSESFQLLSSNCKKITNHFNYCGRCTSHSRRLKFKNTKTNSEINMDRFKNSAPLLKNLYKKPTDFEKNNSRASELSVQSESGTLSVTNSTKSSNYKQISQEKADMKFSNMRNKKIKPRSLKVLKNSTVKSKHSQKVKFSTNSLKRCGSRPRKKRSFSAIAVFIEKLNSVLENVIIANSNDQNLKGDKLIFGHEIETQTTERDLLMKPNEKFTQFPSISNHCLTLHKNENLSYDPTNNICLTVDPTHGGSGRTLVKTSKSEWLNKFKNTVSVGDNYDFYYCDENRNNFKAQVCPLVNPARVRYDSNLQRVSNDRNNEAEESLLAKLYQFAYTILGYVTFLQVVFVLYSNYFYNKS